MKHARTHKAWLNMRQRCLNPNCPDYHNYGARGITISKRWNSYDNFLADLGECPDGYSLERLAVNKGYSPANCMWVPRSSQNRNRRDNVRLTWRGKRQLLLDWAKELGLSYKVLEKRIGRGWSVKRAFTQAVRPRTVKPKEGAV